MRKRLGRLVLVAFAGLWLAACNTVGDSFPDSVGLKATGADAFAAASPQDAADVPLGEPTPDGNLLGANPADDLSSGKAYFRAANYGMAEKYFRRAVELHPNDAESWLDLAASYDHLKRFDLADRAYAQAIGLVGPKIEILNNQGYSYMLRGDNARAYAKLNEARRRDPANRFVLSNLQLLEQSARKGKAID
ncbi:MAG: tetratricopeptide repeat protein [Pseudolabrys sp.]|jgi:Flp pilus assembly protein TadD